MKKLLKNFYRCGILGWCLEICFTASTKILQKDFTLKGITSLWMFPIYGLACLLKPLYKKIKYIPWFNRGLIYMLLIFFTEYTSGKILQKHNLCPWNYSNRMHQFKGLICFDFAPFWFLTGLLYEHFLCRDQSVS